MWRGAIRTAVFGAIAVGCCVGLRTMADEPSAAGSVDQPIYEAAFAAEDYPQTISAASCAIESDPECAGAYSKRGRSNARLGKLDAAIPDCKQAVVLDPQNTEYRAHLACLYHVTGNHDDALEHYSAAIDLGSRDYFIFSNRGALYLERELFPQALSDLNEAVRLDPTEALAYANRSGLYSQQGKYDLAFDDASESIRLAPSQALGYLNRGVARGGKQDYAGAVSDLTRAIELDPRCLKAYYARSAAYVDLGRVDEALDDIRRAIELAPEHSPYHRFLANLHYRRGEIDEAIESATEAVRLDPTDATSLCYRSDMYRAQQKYDLALADANEAVRLAPDDVQGYLCRGSAFGGQGEYGQAIADVTMAIELSPTSSRAYLIRGRAHRGLRKLEEAIVDFSQAIELGLDDARVYVSRGDCHLMRQEYDKARADYDTTIELAPSSPFGYERRGALCIERGDYDQGIADIETALRLNPNDPAATFDDETPPDLVALEHGERQVRQMLQDRPAMTQHGEAADALYQWAERMFAREHGRQRIQWDPAEPPPGPDAISYLPTVDRPGSIRVRNAYDEGPRQGKQRSFEELWQNAVFELYNVNNADSHRRVMSETYAGESSRIDFVRKMIGSEARAAESTRAFYIHVFLPWAKKHRVTTRPTLWYVAWRSTPTDNLLQGRVMGTPYWQYYERAYDLIALRSMIEEEKWGETLALAAKMPRHNLTEAENVTVGRCTSKAVHSLMIRGKYQEAVGFAAKIPRQTQTEEEKALIANYTGYCLVRLNRPAAAVTAFDDVIQLAPTKADAFMGRAAAFALMDDSEHAIADASEAIRLRRLDAKLYLFRAKLYEQIGHQDHARSDYATAKTLSDIGKLFK
jgi:tetratricopeptide (TPR) repeat protein